ncbi:MAG: hypothetical protein NZ889_01555, partial [Candidatus Pacearchaeota archaeon]|nr:hypothetical protein [Candidatus Pacearchaeota archaeon]
QEKETSMFLRKTPLALWLPTLKRIREGMSEVTKSLPLPIRQPSLQELRSLLSNEKARLLWLIKTKKPRSVYELTKLSGRHFKAVRQDLDILEKFGLIKFIKEKEKNREKLKPVLCADKLILHITL